MTCGERATSLLQILIQCPTLMALIIYQSRDLGLLRYVFALLYIFSIPFRTLNFTEVGSCACNRRGLWIG